MKLPKYKLLVIFCFFFVRLYPQPSGYKFNHIDIATGLSNNQINTIFKDSRGFMWFGTVSGLNRYDGHSIRIFKHSIRDSLSIRDNYILNITEDHNKNLWVTTRIGINIYNPKSETFRWDIANYLTENKIPLSNVNDIYKDNSGNYWYLSHTEGLIQYQVNKNGIPVIKHFYNRPEGMVNNGLSAFIQSPDNAFWLIHRNGVLEKIDGKTHEVVFSEPALFKTTANPESDYTLFVDSDGDLWIINATKLNGLYFYNTQKRELRHIDNTSPGLRLNTNLVRSIVQDNTGNIWVATDHGGINIIEKKSFKVSYILNKPNDNRSISQNSFTCLYKDDVGIIWAGTYKMGVDYYHENLVRFNLIRHQSNVPGSLSFGDINCFAEDADNNLWIGTNGGGLIYYDRKKGSFRQYVNNPFNNNSLSNNVIVGLRMDSKQRLWVGTYHGGLNCFVNGNFKRFVNNPSDLNSLSDNKVWDIYEDRNKRLWVGTLGGGLDLFDEKTNSFTHFNTSKPNTIYSNFIMSLLEDKEGRIWVGTAWGIDVLCPDSFKNCENFRNDANDIQSLSNNNILSLLEDSRGFIWIGTREGLNCFDKNTRKFRNFRKEDGLPDNTIVSMLEDNSGNLWIATPNGLSNLIITKHPVNKTISYVFKNFDESDGLQSKEFNEKAAFRTRNGELVFGGINGINIFKPEDIKVNMHRPSVVITGLQVLNNNININEEVNGRILLRQTITETQEIQFKYKENFIVIEFSALSYFQPSKNQYMYKLDGFNEEWIIADSRIRKATYTNLSPGEYIFRVKAANNDGIWSNNETTLKLTVLPPFWRTNLAIFIYFLLALIILYFSRRFVLERARMRFNLEHERQEAQRMHELDMLKIRFFTNISHEFRTPLTLIITPIEKLIKNTTDLDLNKQYVMINRNAKRLLNLINQLLDFRRMEVQEFTLNLNKTDIVRYIHELADSFSDISEKKNIQLSVISKIEHLQMWYDSDKVEKIIFNLLSNAFKFTGENGKITIELDFINPADSPAVQFPDNEHKYLQIKVTDTGIGIAREKHEKIFERFFQNEIPGNMVNQGSGIGLAITKEFVKLHSGLITLDSTPGVGSCFTIYLPFKETDELRENIFPVKEKFTDENINLESNIQAESDSPVKDSKKALLLLVEDNEDFRFYLKDNLKQLYQVAEAPNGQDGHKLALSLIPDLIVSDVMMPVMDGIELCKRIKSDQRTSHIPVILLTAKATSEQVVTGFQTGADDYITKPFNFEILLSRIKNLLAKRDLMRKSFVKHVEVNPSEITVTSLDEKLINKALAIVEANISNADFSVEDLSKELGMSRVHLYKKLLAITGKTPIEFIRTIRLKRAAQLLKKSQLTISEIAYQVGFNNPKYFTKYFKAEFNMLPSQFISDNP